jgi:hypothetical protein
MINQQLAINNAFLVSHGLPIAVANIGCAQALPGLLIDRSAFGVAPVAVSVTRT